VGHNVKSRDVFIDVGLEALMLELQCLPEAQTSTKKQEHEHEHDELSRAYMIVQKLQF
jgi:hypothetical protein